VKLSILLFGSGDKNMNENDMEYMKNQSNTERVIRTEILFTPLLVILPIFIGLLFIYDWYSRGIVEGNSGYFGSLIIGIIIIIGNIFFDLPFIRSLRKLTKMKNKK
jgi:hypothetical protein